MKPVLLALTLSSLTGCLVGRPDPIAVPRVTAQSQVEYTSTYERSSSYNAIVKTGAVDEQGREVHGMREQIVRSEVKRVKIDGQQVDRAQLAILADANFDAKLEEYDRRRSKCHFGRNVVIGGLVVGLGGLIAAGAIGSETSAGKAVGWASIGVGLGGAVAGWYLGLNTCGSAGTFRSSIDHTAKKGDKDMWDPEDEVDALLAAAEKRFGYVTRHDHTDYNYVRSDQPPPADKGKPWAWENAASARSGVGTAPSTPAEPMLYQVGQAVEAQWSVNNKWYAAHVLRVLPAGVEVKYDDDGNVEVRPYSLVRRK